MGSRQNFNDGQEIIFQDLNKIPEQMEKLIFNNVIFEMIGRNSQGFFQDSLNVTRVSNTEVNIKAGLGFQFIATDMLPIILAANSNQIIPAANATNDRIDLVVVKAELVDGASESRKFKDAFTDTISTTSQVVEKNWESSFQIVGGTPAGSPVAPAVPAGYVLLCEILVEAANGIVASSNITDKRTLLPLAGFSGTTGSHDYDAIVGDSSILGISHETLKAALDDPAIGSGSKILVTRSELIGAIPQVDDDEIEIVFKPNITFTKDGVVSGLIINADGVKVSGARFQDFSTAGDKAIVINAAKKYTIIEKCRFLNCDATIDGAIGQNITINNIEE